MRKGGDNLFIPKGKRYWYFNVYDDMGKQRKFSTRVEPSKPGVKWSEEKKGIVKKAEAARSRILAEKGYGTPRFSQERKAVSFEVLFNEYYERHSRVHKKSHRHDLYKGRHLLEAFAGVRVDKITPLAIERYKAKRRKVSGPATINRELALIKHIYTKGIEWGYCRENPAKGVKLCKEPPSRNITLTDDERMRLIESCDHRIRPIVLVALHTGMRQGEIMGMRWENVRFKGVPCPHILLPVTKSGKPREIPMNHIVYQVLYEQPRNGERVFNRSFPRYSWEKAVQESRLNGLRFHDLRHEFGTRLVNNVPLPRIKELLGHSTIQMTMSYLHTTSLELKEAVDYSCENSPEWRNWQTQRDDIGAPLVPPINSVHVFAGGTKNKKARKSGPFTMPETGLEPVRGIALTGF